MVILAVPSWFEYIINSMLDASEVDVASMFLDDVAVNGTAADWR